MKRVGLAVLALVLAGCGVQPSGVTDAGRPPTGLAPGVTLYFVDAHEKLVPQLRRSGHLGTITEAESLLLTGPGVDKEALHTEVGYEGVTRVAVTTAPGEIHLTMPLTRAEVTARGVDQIVCTALGVYVQAGGARTTTVQVSFTEGAPSEPRTCPTG